MGREYKITVREVVEKVYYCVSESAEEALEDYEWDGEYSHTVSTYDREILDVEEAG